MPTSPDLDLLLRLSARAMGRHGLVHAFGHVSQRLDEHAFLVSPGRPLSALGSTDEGVIVSINGELPEGILGEVRLHREVYRCRADVGGICRIQPPALMALSAMGRTPRALHGLGSYFAPAPPLWAETALVRDDRRAAEVASQLGDAIAIILRGNGAIVTGADLKVASANAFFLEDAARVELALLPAEAAGIRIREFTRDEVLERAVATGGIYERMWQFLCLGDSEWKEAA